MAYGIYSVKDLRENLAEKVFGLGIDPKFMENPAYASAIAGITDLILQMNMLTQESESISAREEDGKISFGWESTNGHKYSMTISSSNPESFSCVRVEEGKPYVNANGDNVREKNACELVASINRFGTMTLTEHRSYIINSNYDNKISNLSSADMKEYTPEGVMSKECAISLPDCELPLSFDHLSEDTMLQFARESFTGRWKYDKKTIVTRDKLDTARMSVEDEHGIIYDSTVSLNDQYGLREMVPALAVNQYPERVVIPALSHDKIEEMISREKNPKVAEGLRKYAVDRESYSYDSSLDKGFVCEVTSQTNKAK